METEYEQIRSERRSFFCPNKLWKRIKEKTNDCYSISRFIREAIEEKIEK